MNPRELLETRKKSLECEINDCLGEILIKETEVDEINTTLRVLDRYAIRLMGDGKAPRERQKSDFNAKAPSEPVQTETPDKVTNTAPSSEALQHAFEMGKEAEQTGFVQSDMGRVEDVIASVPLVEPDRKLTPEEAEEVLADVFGSEPTAIVAEILNTNGLEPHSPVHAQPPLANPKPFDMRSKAGRAFKEASKPVTSHERKYGTEDQAEESNMQEAHIPPEPLTLPADKRTNAYKQAQADRETLQARRNGTANVDHSATEPAPAWRGKRSDAPDIYRATLPEGELSLAGSYIMFDGKMIAHVDKWEKSVLSVLISRYGQNVERKYIKGMVKDIDKVIGEVRGKVALTPAKIETTSDGWKLCER